MKFLKYIAAALLLVAGLASCNGVGKEGTPGKTTVQFAQAEVKEGFGAGVVYVPISITADSEAEMNTCAVQVKIKPVTTGEQYEGIVDTDYRITSCDINIPAYNSYFDENEPKKYYNEETKKWTKEVRAEILIVNDKPDEIHFTLEIESSTTSVGEQKQCLVILKKTNRDRICGLYEVTFDTPFWIGEEQKSIIGDDPQLGRNFPADVTKYTWTQAQIIWVPSASAFAIIGDNILTGYGIYYWGYYDATDLDGDPETDDGRMYFVKQEPLVGWDVENGEDEDETNDVIVSAFVQNYYDTVAKDWVSDRKIYWDFNAEEGVLSFPEEIAFTVSLHEVANNSDITDYIGDVIPAYKKLVFTKVQK